jgi:hypothetical protein
MAPPRAGACHPVRRPDIVGRIAAIRRRRRLEASARLAIVAGRVRELASTRPERQTDAMSGTARPSVSIHGTADDDGANIVDHLIAMQRSGWMAIGNAGIIVGAAIMVAAAYLMPGTHHGLCYHPNPMKGSLALVPAVGMAAIAGLRQLLAFIPAPGPLPRAVVRGGGARQLRNDAVAAIGAVGSNRRLATVLHLGHNLLATFAHLLTVLFVGLIGAELIATRSLTASNDGLTWVVVGIGSAMVSAAALGRVVAWHCLDHAGSTRHRDEGAP